MYGLFLNMMVQAVGLERTHRDTRKARGIVGGGWDRRTERMEIAAEKGGYSDDGEW